MPDAIVLLGPVAYVLILVRMWWITMKALGYD